MDLLWLWQHLVQPLPALFAAGNRVLDILDEQPLVEDVVGQKDISYEGVRVSELSFAYDNEQILDNIPWIFLPIRSWELWERAAQASLRC